MSSMTGPVSAAKGKKNWEQLQQESEASEREGVQVRVTVLLIVMMICSDNDYGDYNVEWFYVAIVIDHDDVTGPDHVEKGRQRRDGGAECPGN